MDEKERMNHVDRSESGSDGSLTDKKRVILGDEDFSSYTSEAPKEDNTSEKPGALKSFFNKVSNGKSVLFNEEKDREVAQESVKKIPVEIYEADYKDNTKIKDDDYILDREATPAVETKQKQTEPIILTEKEKLQRKNKNRLIAILVVIALFALAFWLIPMIQEAVFKTKDDSLIFRTATGLFGPRAGVIMIGLGVLGLIMTFFTFFSKTREERLSKRLPKNTSTQRLRTAGLIIGLLIPIGISTFFNFTEFRTNDIRSSSLFNRNKLTSYTEVSRQNVYLEGSDLIYEIFMGNNSVKIPVTNVEPVTVKLLDTKMNQDRNIRIDSDAMKEVVNKKVYTEQEAVRVYKIISGQ